ncbi:MAG TPA: magnesium transporter [Longimicrobium sp.]|nr:magnesium transporter [Longimicrobium sp.]
MSTVIELPESTGVVPHPDNSVSIPAGRLCRFNRGFLDRTDPVEGTGIALDKFSFSLTYRGAPEKHAAVIDSLYHRVYTRLRKHSIPLARPELVEYDDAQTGVREEARRYVVVRGNTLRTTHMDVFATFRSYGDYLYISVDSFLLPPISILRLIWAGVVALGITLWGWLFIAPFVYGIAMLGMTRTAALFGSVIPVLFFTCPVVLWRNRDVIRSIRHGDSIGLALQRHYYQWRTVSAFDNDDVRVHFKSITLLIAEEIAAVFKEHGIPIEELQQVQQTINMTTTITNSGSLNVLGSMLVGVGNAIGGGKN